MGENPEVPGRQSVRTPMQWSDDRNGGFSTAAPSRLVAPPPEDGYAPAHVNVRQQRTDDDSLLLFVRRLISRYRASPEIGWGSLEILDHDAPGVLAHAVNSEIGRMILLHNFTDEAVALRLDIGAHEDGTRLIDLDRPGLVPVGAERRIDVELPAYGHRWLRVSPPGDTRIG